MKTHRIIVESTRIQRRDHAYMWAKIKQELKRALANGEYGRAALLRKKKQEWFSDWKALRGTRCNSCGYLIRSEIYLTHTRHCKPNS